MYKYKYIYNYIGKLVIMSCKDLTIDISCCLDFNNSKVEDYYNTNRTPINWFIIDNEVDANDCNESPKWNKYCNYNKFRGYGFTKNEHFAMVNNIKKNIENYVEILKLKNELTIENIIKYISFTEIHTPLDIESKFKLINNYIHNQ